MPTNNTPQPHQPAQPEFWVNTQAELLEGGRNIDHQAIDKTRTAFWEVQLQINGQDVINGMESPVSTLTHMLWTRWDAHAENHVWSYEALELTLEPAVVMALWIDKEYENFFKQSRFIAWKHAFLQKENLPMEAWLSIVLASWAYAKNLDVICEYGEGEALKIAIFIPLDFRKTWWAV